MTSSRLTHLLALIAGIVWFSYTLHGFRPLWQPIVETDANVGSAMRQVVFAGCGAAVAYRFWVTARWAEVVERGFPWLCLAALLAVSVTYSIRPGLTLKRSVLFGAGMVTILGLVYLPRRPVEFFLWSSAYVTGGIALLSLGMWATMPTEFWSTSSRQGLCGITSHPNVLGPAMAFGFLVALGVPRQTRAVGRWTLRVIRVSLLVALVLTESIASILVIAVGVILFFVLIASAYRRGAAMLFLVFGALLFNVDPSYSRDLMFDSMGRDASLSGRDTLWADVAREVSKQPLLGAGYGAFWYEGRGREIVGSWNPRQSHNAYLDVLADVGWIGLLAVAALVIRAGTRGRYLYRSCGPRERTQVAALLATPIAFLAVGGLAESFLLKMDKFQFFGITWILVLLEHEHDSREIYNNASHHCSLLPSRSDP